MSFRHSSRIPCLRRPTPGAIRHPSFNPRARPLSSHQSPTPWRKDEPTQQYSGVENALAEHAFAAFSYFGRFIKFSFFGIIGLGVVGWTAFEGAHMWVEMVELTPESNDECKRWQWDLDAERWTGGDRGGTDPALGFKGRHAVRSAWMAQNWGVGDASSNVITSKAFSGKGGGGGLNAVEARLEFAQDFLNIAFDIALSKEPAGHLRPQTATEILSRHADIMERMGSRDGLYQARSELQRVWARLSAKGLDAARIALKLGDLNQRLGAPEDAQAWWARSIQLVSGHDAPPALTPVIPESVPSSPFAQRTLASALVSLSAFYATSGQLRQAQAAEETALNLLRTIPTPQNFASSSPPQALHALYLLHRSSLISVHLAEVTYALRSPAATSMQWLSRAAESSERVARVLTGLPAIHPDAPESKIPHPPSSESALLSVFSKSPSMKKPAKSLLRDARRTAAEAWNLMGVLKEDSGKPGSAQDALECYERALGWAGVAADRAGGIGRAGEGVLETEWKVLWSNYVRVRDIVRSPSKDT
ncbi:hypothetical protein OF83DRAFT_1053737 [Amylostereum chailletii]|nr:hypothetical protein OF83DRAFT_1053737 [Amylostereum chailletii]